MLNNKHLFAAQKIELKLHIEGDFSAEDQIKIRNQKPSFFPLYLSLSQEDEFEVSMKQDGMLIHWVKTDKKPFLVYHGDLRQAGQT